MFAAMKRDCRPTRLDRGSAWLRIDEHQSAAWPIALPGVLNVVERDAFRVYPQFPFCRICHHLAERAKQNVARWNPGSALNCQCGTA